MTTENFGFIPDAQVSNVPTNNFGFIPESEPAQPSTLQTVASSPGIQFALGAGDALRNTIASGLNMLTTQPSAAQKNSVSGIIGGLPLPQTQNIPTVSPVNTGNGGLAYGLGGIAGNTAAFMGGGDVLDAARAASEGVPVIGSIASALGGNGLSGVARRAIGSAAYGAASTPQNRLSNAGWGAGLSVGADTIPGAAALGTAAAEYFQPQKYSQKIIEGLSGGQNMQDAANSVLAAVKNSYEAQKENASDLYNSVFNSVPSGSIYAKIGKNNSQYLNLPSDITNYNVNSIKNLHNKFIANPTFQNAHDLQSQIGSRLREIQSTPFPPPATKNEIESLSQAQNALIDRDSQGNVSGDMGNFLNNLSPDLANQYKNASDNFFENVVPYRNSTKISPIASGHQTSIKPSSLPTIFAAPDANTSKVISDLPDGTMDKVLYAQLGKDTPSSNPFHMIKAYNRLQEQGLGSYVSPTLSQQIGSLQNRINWRSRLQSAAGGATAALAGGAEHGAGGAVGMGLAGASLASPFMNFLGRRLQLDKAGEAISNVLRGTYPIGRSAFIANKLNNSGVNQ